LTLLTIELRCKLQEKMHNVTGPLAARTKLIKRLI
jgi:hypothetical protein